MKTDKKRKFRLKKDLFVVNKDLALAKVGPVQLA